MVMSNRMDFANDFQDIRLKIHYLEHHHQENAPKLEYSKCQLMLFMLHAPNMRYKCLFFASVCRLFQLRSIQAMGGHQLSCEWEVGFISSGQFLSCYFYLTCSSFISGILTCISVNDIRVQAVLYNLYSGWAHAQRSEGASSIRELLQLHA